MRYLMMALAISLALSCPLFAQEVVAPRSNRDRDAVILHARELAQELERTTIRRGHLYLLSQFRLGEIAYDEDFFLPVSNRDTGVGITVSAPHKLYYVPHRKFVLSTEVTPSYTLFPADRQFNEFGYLARGDARLLFNHLFLDFYGSTSRALSSRPADIDQLATVRTVEYGLEGELKYSSRSTAQFSSSVSELVHPTDDLQPAELSVGILDRRDQGNRLLLTHRTFPVTSLTLAGGVSVHDFDVAKFKDSRRTYVAPGFLYQGSVLTARGEAGPARLDFKAPSERDWSGIIGSLFAQRETRRWVYGINATRDVDFSVFALNNYYVRTRGSASADYSATRRLRLRAQTVHEGNDYDVPVQGIDRADRISYSTLGFRYRLRRLQGGIDVGPYSRKSTFPGLDEDGIRFTLHLSFTP